MIDLLCRGEATLVPVQTLAVVPTVEELDFFKGVLAWQAGGDGGMEIEEGMKGGGACLLGPNDQHVRHPGTRLVGGQDVFIQQIVNPTINIALMHDKF